MFRKIIIGVGLLVRGIGVARADAGVYLVCEPDPHLHHCE